MKSRIGALAALSMLFACAPALAAPAKVGVRIEGPTKTLFDGTVTTSPHSINKDPSGPHVCDGTNGGANAQPGPTVHTALDDASKLGGFGWSGTWNPQFSDFFVQKIGPIAGTGASYWSEAVNFKDTSAGGCQVEVKPGDQVLFYFVSGKAPKYTLELTGAHTARVGKAFKVHVIDGKTGANLAGAKVDGKKANHHGIVTLRFSHAGTVKLKATLPNAVRSNSLVVSVKR